MSIHLSSYEPIQESSPNSKKKSRNSAITDALYGVINAVIILPVTISFTSIIFRDSIFTPYLPIFVKLVLFSSVVHQIMFSLLSSMPFSVGQVQDAGLIFLSSMASTIVENQTNKGTPERIVPTTLVALSIATVFLGVVIVIIGKFKLASYLQFLPVPVIGGYLAYIGFFCGQAGVAMMSGQQLVSIADWTKILNQQSFFHLLPGVLGGMIMYLSVRRFPSAITLPCLMASGLIAFYVALLLSGASMSDARREGWVMQLTEEVPVSKIWSLFDASLIDWSELPGLGWQWLGLCVVVGISSTLDIAAIEMEVGTSLDYDREITMIGISNFVSGLIGGYSGSYIFSQTIFSLRRGVGRICGLIIIVAEVVVLLIPYPPTAYTPKLFYGALLVFIAADLIYDWLICAGNKMSRGEACVCWGTFIFIQMFNIEIGMLIGVGLALLEFAVCYAQSQHRRLSSSSHRALMRSPIDRSPSRLTTSQNQLLVSMEEKYQTRAISVDLSGYLFFGTAISSLESIKQYLHQHNIPIYNDSHSFDDSGAPINHITALMSSLSRKITDSASGRRSYDTLNGISMSNTHAYRQDKLSTDFPNSSSLQSTYIDSQLSNYSPEDLEMHQLGNSTSSSSKILVINMIDVVGCDSTFAQTCLEPLVNSARHIGMHLAFVGVQDETLSLLIRGGIVTDTDSII